MTQKYLILTHFRIKFPLAVWDQWGACHAGHWVRCALCGEPCVYTATQWKRTKLQDRMSHSYPTTDCLPRSCLPSSAAEEPGLGHKLVSFNIHKWWEAVSRSVKTGLKGLCRRWAQSGGSGTCGGGGDSRSKAGICGAVRQEQDCMSQQSKATDS